MEHSENYAGNIIELDSLKEFTKYAKKATLFIYEPDFFSSPFKNEIRIRSVICYAIGVKFQDVSVILKYQKTWHNSHLSPNSERRNPKDVIDSSMRVFINQVETQFHALKGKLSRDNMRPVWRDFIEYK
ncbi:MAG: hypothetical protein LUQ65_11460 [Candidatus Helarchaeota archaeon]|nr:hypothetical protein [Candidatus Helarchaeota archaeon]